MNSSNPKIRIILETVKSLPFFDLEDLLGVEKNRTYLKVLLSRYVKTGKVIRLKRGLYVTKNYFEKLENPENRKNYLEFLSGTIYSPSYLSLDYVLSKHNIIAENPINFTAVSKKKTASFSNIFGNYFYHKVRNDLFCGFELVKENDFTIFRATKAKALFDYLYLRKNDLSNEESFSELRLNLSEFSTKDRKELKEYIKIERSKKMKEIFNYLFN